jgi:TolB-like protein
MTHPSAERDAVAEAVPPHEVEAALARVLGSAPVRASRRTSDFLAFTIGEVLAGRGSELRERVVGVGALGRSPTFDPRVDPAVRVQARRVRTALDRYYAGPGAGDPVRIELPTGSYVPVFRPNPSPLAGPAAAAGPTTGPGIAVASLLNLTPGGDHDYLAPGLSETLVARLSRFPDCRVIGPVSLDPSGQTGLDALRERHDAQFVLMGSTRTRGGSLRVTVRLIDTTSGETTWAQVFDRRLDDDGFDIEDGIVAEVGGARAD